MSHLKSNGELSPAALAQAILSLRPFSHITQGEYQFFLSHLLETLHIEKTENGGLIIGRAGERVVNDFHFYTVFTVPEYYLVKDENRSIGTVDKIYPPGTRFALAGMTWETVSVNQSARVLFVKQVPGISVVDWDVDFTFNLHTVLVRKMRSILQSDDNFSYLSDSCKERLHEIRYLARNSGILDSVVTKLSERKFAVFPWVGTRQLSTLHYALLHRQIKSKMLWDTCIYLEVYFEGTADELTGVIFGILQSELDVYALPLPNKAQILAKYNDFLPESLLRKQFAEDFLDFEGLCADIALDAF